MWRISTVRSLCGIHIYEGRRGLALHHLHASALLGQEVMLPNAQIGVSNCACVKLNFADVLAGRRGELRRDRSPRPISVAELLGFEDVSSEDRQRRAAC